jgi:hypothetical protein
MGCYILIGHLAVGVNTRATKTLGLYGSGILNSLADGVGSTRQGVFLHQFRLINPPNIDMQINSIKKRAGDFVLIALYLAQAAAAANLVIAIVSAWTRVLGGN